jgi:hypothetical protein
MWHVDSRRRRDQRTGHLAPDQRRQRRRDCWTSSGAVYGGTGTNDITAGTLNVTANGSSTRGGGTRAIDGSGGLHTTVPRIASLTAASGRHPRSKA